jgi:hypothetical protein
MAVENADLVDITFILEYLSAIRNMQKKLDWRKTEAFVDLARNKFQDESTKKYILDVLVN